MKQIIIGLVALSSLSAFSQGIEMKITNKNYPSRAITLTCLDSDCSYMRIKTPSTEKTIDQLELINYSKAKLERDAIDRPFSFVVKGYTDAKRDFEHGDVARGVSNSVVSIVSVPVDIFLLPMKTAAYFGTKREGIELKRASKKLIKFLKKNKSFETEMRDFQFSKLEEGLDLI